MPLPSRVALFIFLLFAFSSLMSFAGGDFSPIKGSKSPLKSILVCKALLVYMLVARANNKEKNRLKCDKFPP